ncbi:hypothetical protein [Noviherbaspirillum aerium]|uniref:hypothetical protein n=1 Tax=Noviherbaspirillum aerium TaxID=2588497 RepID=UPI00178C6A3E|nr:hypothetical protein [Noviherbaspirillum aerium]
MPGIAEEMEGAMQQAPHPVLQDKLLMASETKEAKAACREDCLNEIPGGLLPGFAVLTLIAAAACIGRRCDSTGYRPELAVDLLKVC